MYHGNVLREFTKFFHRALLVVVSFLFLFYFIAETMFDMEVYANSNREQVALYEGLCCLSRFILRFVASFFDGDLIQLERPSGNLHHQTWSNLHTPSYVAFLYFPPFIKIKFVAYNESTSRSCELIFMEMNPMKMNPREMWIISLLMLIH